MPKVELNSLVLEVTRRCNFKCLHCIRGDPQNIDLDPKIFKEFLEVNNITKISQFIITGGEPTLVLDIIDQVMDIVISKNIIIDNIFIKINGSKISDSKLIRFFKLILKMNKITNFNLEDIDYAGVSIRISNDPFHQEFQDQESIDKLLLFTNCQMDNEYNNIILLGKAIENKEYIMNYNYSFVQNDFIQNVTIDYDENGNYQVLDLITLTCTGKVLSDCDYSYDLEDYISICMYNEDLISELEEDE